MIPNLGSSGMSPPLSETPKCLAGKSSLLNLPKAPLKLGGAVVAVMGDKLTDVTTGASSLLRP